MNDIVNYLQGKKPRLSKQVADKANDLGEAEARDVSTVDVCPVCRFELKYLRDHTPQRHINECLDSAPVVTKVLCSGDNCPVTDPKHFLLFEHDGSGRQPRAEKHSLSVEAISSGIPGPSCADASSKLKSISVSDVVSTTACAKVSTTDVLADLSEKVSGRRKSVKSASMLRQQSIATYFAPKRDAAWVPLSHNQGQTSIKAATETKPVATAVSGQTNRVEKLSSSRYLQNSERNQFKRCPAYKLIPGTGISVDAFCYGVIPGCTAYFLSHFHSDHYRGLSSSFKGTLYCSKVTANLVTQQLRLKRDYVMALPIGEWMTVENVRVLLLDANHCPGSVMFLIELCSGRRILHTGDFRASHELASNSCLSERPIDVVYLDTTYCDPSYDFASQSDVIGFALDVCRRALVRSARTLICSGTYSIGKERLFVAIAKEFGFKVGVSASKLRILSCLEDEELNKLMTRDLRASQIHVLPMAALSFKSLNEHLSVKCKSSGYEHVLAFKPTGWTHSAKVPSLQHVKPRVRQAVTIYDVPYSEHSSYKELEHFVRTLRPSKVIPTVNVGDVRQREKMNAMFLTWLSDR